ncbi:hypothetical protein [Phenylobacterium sp.]|uniref:hypothetical protein n=1 Tax=Phenylobacterium sp. TaxID=1871053 RepID=UPI002FE18AC2
MLSIAAERGFRPSDAMKAVGAAVMLTVVVGVSALAPGDSAEAAAVFPPWWPQGAAVTAAASAGDVVAVGAGHSIVIVRSSGGGPVGRPLQDAGALVVFAPGPLAGCLAPGGRVRAQDAL